MTRARTKASVMDEFVTAKELGDVLIIGERQLTRVFEFVLGVERDAGGRNPRATVRSLLEAFYLRDLQAGESRRESFLLGRIATLRMEIDELKKRRRARVLEQAEEKTA